MKVSQKYVKNPSRIRKSGQKNTWFYLIDLDLKSTFLDSNFNFLLCWVLNNFEPKGRTSGIPQLPRAGQRGELVWGLGIRWGKVLIAWGGVDSHADFWVFNRLSFEWKVNKNQACYSYHSWQRGCIALRLSFTNELFDNHYIRLIFSAIFREISTNQFAGNWVCQQNPWVFCENCLVFHADL